MSKEEIKKELAHYTPNEEERAAIKSAMFNVINLATVGAASLSLSGHLWNKSRPRPTAIPTILGFFTGLALGGALGMDKGMRTLRSKLPADSKLLGIIRETDQIRSGSVIPIETDVHKQQDVDAFVPDEKSTLDNTK